jgi:hypothetical protein
MLLGPKPYKYVVSGRFEVPDAVFIAQILTELYGRIILKRHIQDGYTQAFYEYQEYVPYTHISNKRSYHCPVEHVCKVNVNNITHQIQMRPLDVGCSMNKAFDYNFKLSIVEYFLHK